MKFIDAFNIFQKDSRQDPVTHRFRVNFVCVSNALVMTMLIGIIVFAAAANYGQQVRAVNDVLNEEVRTRLDEMGCPLPADSPDEADSADDALVKSDLPNRVQIYPDGAGGLRLDDSIDEPRITEEDAIVSVVTYLRTPGGESRIISSSDGIPENVVEEAVDIAMGYIVQGGSQISQGSIGILGLRYAAYEGQDGEAVVTFASSNFIKHSMNSLLVSLGVPALIASFVFFLASVVLSQYAVRPFEETWLRQQRFIADASHELKTPLSVIMASNSLAQADPAATVESKMRWLETIDSESQRMLDLVNDMLFLAQSNSVASARGSAIINFSDLVMGEALHFESLAFERGVTLEVHISDGVCVLGISSQLKKLIGTLLDNACKYAGPDGEVVLTLFRRDTSAYLRVRNNGPCIPKEDLPYIFDRFYRADRARNRQTGGFGLGLAIAKDIVGNHNGSIEAASEEEWGTCFTVRLPIANSR